jgi:hypothetical protein
LYDPSTGNWTKADDELVPLAWSTASVLKNGNVLMVGGMGGFQPPASKVSMLYNPSMKAFTSYDGIENPQPSQKIFVAKNEKVPTADDNFKTTNDKQRH